MLSGLDLMHITITNVVLSSPFEITVWAEQCASPFGFYISNESIPQPSLFFESFSPIDYPYTSFFRIILPFALRYKKNKKIKKNHFALILLLFDHLKVEERGFELEHPC